MVKNCYTILVQGTRKGVTPKMEVYRLVIKRHSKWHTGKPTYSTQQEANQRRDYLIQLGVKPNNIKVKSETELFN